MEELIRQGNLDQIKICSKELTLDELKHCLNYACILNNIDIVQYFIQIGVPVDECIYSAIDCCNLDIFKLLLKHGENWDYIYLLDYAVSSSTYLIVEYMLTYDIYTDINIYTIIQNNLCGRHKFGPKFNQCLYQLVSKLTKIE